MFVKDRGQNFFEQIRTKIRTFSGEIRTIRTFFLKKSVPFFKNPSISTIHCNPYI